ncbi:hypothetical protein JRQ81_005944 [Phrynocephalus forsythii]|uniref:Uncharacterized protein n=1 Tax=Phrynocephalus forsythii TaxID=171643 RepID=A0A9Q1B701_9SAUR|nr:hypothetical protein JRQ81_005944 [Phrynocephalus forsythii]
MMKGICFSKLNAALPHWSVLMLVGSRPSSNGETDLEEVNGPNFLDLLEAEKFTQLGPSMTANQDRCGPTQHQRQCSSVLSTAGEYERESVVAFLSSQSFVCSLSSAKRLSEC